jgi:CubicO group peptidase (beta-lactamase class C family)
MMNLFSAGNRRSVIRKAVLLSVLIAASAIAATKPQKPADLTARLDNAVRYYADDDLFSGALLVERGDALLLNKAYGFANREWRVPNTVDTRFRIGSLTKQFTAAAVLRLEEQGKLHVEDRLKQYLSDVPASWDEITLHQLLSHTSGIPNYTAIKRSWTDPITTAEMIGVLRDKPLDFVPGSDYRYSNSNYFLLGAVIEKVSGQKYEQFVRENVFAPAGMKDSGFDHFLTVLDRRASGYNRQGPADVENSGYIDMSVPFSAGGLYSTTGDLLRWRKALFGGKVISEASLKKMTTTVSHDYGYGMVIDTDHNHKRFSHSGSINGFNSFFAYYPDDHLTVVVLSNTKTQATRMANLLAAVVHGDPFSQPTSVPVPENILKKYVGEYGDQAKTLIKIAFENGHLTMHRGDLWEYLVYESPIKFYNKADSIEVDFNTDATGTVTGLTGIANGHEVKFPRLTQSSSAQSSANSANIN